MGQDAEGWRRWEESVVDSDNKHRGKELNQRRQSAKKEKFNIYYIPVKEAIFNIRRGFWCEEECLFCQHTTSCLSASYIRATIRSMGFGNIFSWNSSFFSAFKQKLVFFFGLYFWKEAASRLNSWTQIHTVQADRDFQTTDESDPNLWTLWNFLLVKDKSTSPISKTLSLLPNVTVVMQKF